MSAIALLLIGCTAAPVRDDARKQGVLSSSVVLTQQAAVSMRAHTVRIAQAEQTKALSALAQLLGLSSINRLSLPDHLSVLPLAAFNEPELQALALKHRPELLAKNASIDQANAEKKV